MISESNVSRNLRPAYFHAHTSCIVQNDAFPGQSANLSNSIIAARIDSHNQCSECSDPTKEFNRKAAR